MCYNYKFISARLPILFEAGFCVEDLLYIHSNLLLPFLSNIGNPELFREFNARHLISISSVKSDFNNYLVGKSVASGAQLSPL